MKQRLSLILLVMAAMFMVTTAGEYSQAETTAGEWRTLMGPLHWDDNVSDTDGMSQGDVRDLVGTTFLDRWIPSNGTVSLAVLEKRLQDRAWWPALQLSERLQKQHVGSTVSGLADAVSGALSASILSAALALVCLLAAGFFATRPDPR